MGTFNTSFKYADVFSGPTRQPNTNLDWAELVSLHWYGAWQKWLNFGIYLYIYIGNKKMTMLNDKETM